MRAAKIAFLLAFALSSLPAFAQSALPDGPPPALGPPALGRSGSDQSNETAPPPATGSLPSTAPGSDKVSDDGISRKAARAARCSIAARETDGVTTCVGIRDYRERSRHTR